MYSIEKGFMKIVLKKLYAFFEAQIYVIKNVKNK